MRLFIHSFLFYSILFFTLITGMSSISAQDTQADPASEGIEVTVVAGQTTRTILGVCHQIFFVSSQNYLN